MQASIGNSGPFTRAQLNDVSNGNPSYAKEVNTRIGERRGTERSNCIGTALYLAGEIRKDKFVSTRDVPRRYFEHMQPIAGPVEHALIAWKSRKNGHIFHAGVVTSIDPLLVTNRWNTDGPLFEDQIFAELQDAYDNCEVVCYLPKWPFRESRCK